MSEVAQFTSKESPRFLFFQKKALENAEIQRTDGCQKGGDGGWVEKGKGIKKYKLPVISHRNVTYSTGNIVNKIVITLNGDRLLLALYGSDHFARYINAELPCCTLEANRVLYVNYN